MLKLSRPLVALALGVALVPLAGCASGNRLSRADTRYIARDVNTLYNAAYTQMQRRAYRPAALLFDEVERQHPYSIWARRAQLMSAFNYYAVRDYTKSIESARRFLSIHPGNRAAPYALYLIALCYYERISDVNRDQGITNQAMTSFNELIRRYPNSPYAEDARLKIDLLRDHLAGKEMEVGRFYQRRRLWLAAVTRFRSVIDTYQTTSHTPEALMRLTESYLALGVPTEAQRSAAVLGANFPTNRWYQRAYRLMQDYPNSRPLRVERRPETPGTLPPAAPAAPQASTPTTQVSSPSDAPVPVPSTAPQG